MGECLLVAAFQWSAQALWHPYIDRWALQRPGKVIPVTSLKVSHHSEQPGKGVNGKWVVDSEMGWFVGCGQGCLSQIEARLDN
jgi:hypothetical protein